VDYFGRLLLRATRRWKISKVVNDISVICRANEVRSPTVAAYLKNLIPDLKVNSFGTDITRGSLSNSDISRYLNQWGIEFQQQLTKSVSDHIAEVTKTNFVIACDEKIVRSIASVCPDVVNLQEYAIDNQHIPVDPISFSQKDFLENLCKVLHSTMRFSIQKYLPSSSDFASIAKQVTDPIIDFQKFPDGVYIDTRIKTKNLYRNIPDQVRWFTEEELRSGRLAKNVAQHVAVYAPRFEFRHPELCLLSRQWIEFVRAVETFGSTTLLIEKFDSSKSTNSCSYLATSLASSVD